MEADDNQELASSIIKQCAAVAVSVCLQSCEDLARLPCPSCAHALGEHAAGLLESCHDVICHRCAVMLSPHAPCTQGNGETNPNAAAVVGPGDPHILAMRADLTCAMRWEDCSTKPVEELLTEAEARPDTRWISRSYAVGYRIWRKGSLKRSWVTRHGNCISQARLHPVILEACGALGPQHWLCERLGSYMVPWYDSKGQVDQALAWMQRRLSALAEVSLTKGL